MRSSLPDHTKIAINRTITSLGFVTIGALGASGVISASVMGGSILGLSVAWWLGGICGLEKPHCSQLVSVISTLALGLLAMQGMFPPAVLGGCLITAYSFNLMHLIATKKAETNTELEDEGLDVDL